MMQSFIISNSDGALVSSGTVQAECLKFVQVPDGGKLVLAASDVDIQRSYVEDDRIVAMPPKPSPHHVFDYTTKQWIDPRTPETEWPIVRAERDRRLLACDWTQLPDVPLATKEAWAVYRQALRDITLQPDPFNIVWPTPPT